MEIYSKYLKRNFTISGAELENKTIISHADLEDIVLNQIDDVRFSYSVIETTKPPVFICKMDYENRHVEAIGEATYASLTTEIAKQFPATMAANRAFDRAAIRLLGFEGKVYSDNEIDKTTIKKTTANSNPNPVLNSDANASAPSSSESGVEFVEDLVNDILPGLTDGADGDNNMFKALIEPNPETIDLTDELSPEESEETPKSESPVEETSDNDDLGFGEELGFISDISDDAQLSLADDDISELIVDSNDTIIPDDEVVVETPEVSESIPEVPVSEQSSTDEVDLSSVEGSEMIVSLGRNKSKNITFAELAKTDIDSLIWIANYKPRFEKDAVQVETAKRILTAIGH